MLDIRALEKRWLRYKIKRLFPAIALTLIAISAIITSLLVWPSAKTQPQTPITKPEPLDQSLIQTASKHEVENNGSLDLEPSMEFMNNITVSEPLIETSPQTPSALPKNVSVAPPPPPSKTVPEKVIEAINVSSNSVSKNIPSKKTETLIHKTENKLDIEALEERFKQNPNPSLGLFIARYYYDHGNYAGSYNYALKTNTLNDKMDESWIIFAKSLVKLEKIDQAKKTLKIYIDQSNSDSAKSLLDSIEKGSFK